MAWGTLRVFVIWRFFTNSRRRRQPYTCRNLVTADPMSLTGHPDSHDNDRDDKDDVVNNPELPASSRFTYKNLADLAVASPTCPLRVLAHIDLDAYYAQCEMLRLGTAEDTPLVVQQWRNIIAVNYPARAYGITRMISAAEAVKKCPHLVVQHVASWKEGESQWAYHDDAFAAMAHHKVSLEPYRIRSRAILATLKGSLPGGAGMQAPCKIEKAGIDEVFVDLSPYIHNVLVERYADVLAGYRDWVADRPADRHADETATTLLPRPPVRAADLDWAATGSDVVDGVAGSDADAAVDWDDLAMLEGARVVQAMRATLFARLRFRCSAGIASNKMLSKLGSSQHKPNKQTVVRPRAAAAFLAGLSSVSKLRGLGGKMGARVVAAFGTESIAELLRVPLAQMQAKLGDQEAGYSIYWMIRGVDTSEVTARTEIKSIISAKSFQPPLTTVAQAERWLRVYVGELKCRLLDEKQSLALLAAASVAGAGAGEKAGEKAGVEAGAAGAAVEAVEEALASAGKTDPDNPRTPHQRLPSTIRLHYGQSNGQAYGQGWRSRQTRIPRDGTPLDEDKLLRLGRQLLDQAQQDGTLWPCGHLALSVDGFEALPAKGNKSIASFFQPKEAQASATATTPTPTPTPTPPPLPPPPPTDAPTDAPHDQPPTKRRRTAADDHCKGKGEAERGSSGDEPAAATSRISSSSSSSSSSSHDHNKAVVDHNKAEAHSSGRGSSTLRKPAGLALYFGSANGSTNDSDRGSNNKQIGAFVCGRCSQALATAPLLQEHQDWHVARDLHLQTRLDSPDPPTSNPSRRCMAGHSQSKRGEGGSIQSFFHSQTASSQTASSGINTDSSGGDGGGGVRDGLSCQRCGASFSHADQAQVHHDWHFAKDLAGES